MGDLRCPNLDALGLRLLEAYRQRGDVEIESLSSNNRGAQDQVSVFEEDLRKHCRDCAICRGIRWRKDVVRAFSSDDATWRGVMAS
jgi:hypothetical protein